MSALALCLLWTLATAAWLAPTPPVGSLEPAQQEELTLLFHGTLQLGQALNGVYRATEAQLIEAGHSLGLYGHTLRLLGQEISRGRDAAQELRASLLDTQIEEYALQLHAEATAQVLGEVAQEQQVLWDNVRRLEGQLSGAWLGHSRQEFEALKAEPCCMGPHGPCAAAEAGDGRAAAPAAKDPGETPHSSAPSLNLSGRN
ncbi:angiopoietin-like protein 8 isoform X1 [Nycticebus coucang]|uniref:angiopoietin-like protein 8 isoform X1 n=1 Tax=Nycticebus coucang TaxID=9470 RepID=UPI00234DF09F|nr:angiopoietin-like protein 8 isoform X1 [Nycticebus coucang]